jgi:hypothetical protein
VRDDPSGAVAVHGDGLLPAGLGVAADEDRVEDAGAPVLAPLQRADRLALGLGIRAKSVEQ